MVSILTEKPSAARAFAKALGGMSGTYKGEAYRIVNARGHLYELASPEDQVPKGRQVDYKSWSLDKLPWNEQEFAWKRTKQKDTAALLKSLKADLAGTDELVCAGDVDPSGEGLLISAEIIEELNLRPKKISRMYFADESVKELQKAFENRKVIPNLQQHDEYLMAWYRTRWDFLSMQFTRIATKYGDGKAVLRQGRLKSAMVLLVGKQLDEIKNYKKIPFYENRFRDEHGVVYSNPDEPRFPDKSQVSSDVHASSVVLDSANLQKTAPPRFLDLAGLSALLASNGSKPKEVLDTYQKMYEAGIVSYPRTEDKVITPEQFNDLLPFVDRIAGLVGVDVGLLTHRTPRSTHVKTGGAHGANRPGLTVPGSLEVLSQFGPSAVAIYTTLAKNYLASLAEDYEYEAQKGHLADYPAFKGSCSVPKKPGWKAVFQDTDENDDDVNAAGLGTNAEPFVHEGFPKKPATPTMKWLMKQLEKRDVGTGATRTSTLADVTNERSKYPLMKESRGKLSLTEYGEMSYRLLPGTHIGDLSITERVQGQMKDIAAGKLNADQCLAEMQQMVREDIKTMQDNSVSMRKELNIMADSYAQDYVTGEWAGKEVRFKRMFRGRNLTDQEVQRLLAGETVELDGLIGKNGNTYGIRGALAVMEFNGHKYVGVEQKGFLERIPASWCGHTFSEDELAMLQSDHPVTITDAVSKKTGKTFSCKLRWGEREDGKMGLIPEFG